MVKMSALYEGRKHCLLTHGPSSSQIETDAPKDNQGLGERFSPTDLVGAALISCILTTMAIAAEKDGFSIDGAAAEIEKHMIAAPRRIGALPVRVTLPARLTPEQRKKMEATAEGCPVKRSLHADVDAPLEFRYV